MTNEERKFYVRVRWLSVFLLSEVDLHDIQGIREQEIADLLGWGINSEG